MTDFFRRPSIAAVLVASLLAAPFARAGEAEDKATARDLAKQGIAAEEAGDCATAIDRLERAEQLYHAPIHLQHLAHCYVKQGRFVEATETYRKLTMENLAPNAPPVFKDAVDEAKTELPKLEPRLAHLTIHPKEEYAGLQVTLDGKPYPSAALGISRVVDPGKHVVHASATGYAATDVPVDLKEGGAASITLDLKAGDGGSAVTTVKGDGKTTTTTTPPIADDTSKPFPWKSVGATTMIVGGVAVVGGVITGVVAKSKYDSLQNDCPNKRCPAGYDLQGKQDSIKGMTTMTNVLLVGGGVLVVAGAAAWLFGGPSKHESPAVSFDFSPLAGGGHVSVTGSF